MGRRPVTQSRGERRTVRRSLRAALALAAVGAIVAGCGGYPYTNVTFRNDVGRPVRLGNCGGDPTCRHVVWWIGVDRGAAATEQIRSDGKATLRFVVVGPPEVVFGCFVLHFDGRHAPVTLRMSAAHGCGSGR